MSNSKLVYSTDKTLTNLDESVDVVSVRASEQKVRLHLDRKKGGKVCLLYTSPSPRDATLSRMPSSA